MVLLLPYRADFTFWLSPKSKQKAQGCVRFTRKSYAIMTKNPELVVPPQTAGFFQRRYRLFSGSPTEAVAAKRISACASEKTKEYDLLQGESRFIKF